MIVSQALSAELDLQWKGLLETAKASIHDRLSDFRVPYLPLPGPSLLGREKIREAVAAAIGAPLEETSVKAELRPGGRYLDVDVTVRNPSPATAAAILAAGGRWV
jgi:hypothetical protein